MREIRTIGNNIKIISLEKGVSEEQLSVLLSQSIKDIRMIFAGRKILSFPMLELLSKAFKIPVETLLEEKNGADYNYAIDCMNNFTDESNREKVLDLIYDYLDVLDSVNS